LSFSRAAAELCVTHGAVSHQVRGLTAHLGVALFRRLHRRVRFTEAGEALFARVQATAAGFGVAIGPQPLVTDDLASGRLVAPFGFVPSGLSMYVLYPRWRAQNPHLVAFRNWLMTVPPCQASLTSAPMPRVLPEGPRR
jgi:DNA-binding transcriptional LysR family regulator